MNKKIIYLSVFLILSLFLISSCQIEPIGAKKPCFGEVCPNGDLQKRDNIKPLIDFYTPEANSIFVTNRSINFTCGVRDDSELKKVVFWITSPNKNRFVIDEIRYINGKSANVTFTKQFMKLGNYAWNCQVYDASNNYNWLFTQNNKSAGFIITPNYVISTTFGRNLLDHPDSIAISKEGVIYVGDRTLRNILAFNSNGHYLSKLDVYTSSVAVDSQNEIYLREDGARVNVFTKNWTFIKSIELPQTEYYDLPAMGFDSKDILYISGWYTLHRYNSSNGNLSTIPMYLGPKAFGKDGSIYVIPYQQGVLYKYSSNGSFIRGWTVPGGYADTITVDSQGYLYITNMHRDSFVKYANDGTAVGQWNLRDLSNPGDYFGSAIAMTTDENFNLYVVSVGTDQVRKFQAVGDR